MGTHTGRGHCMSGKEPAWGVVPEAYAVGVMFGGEDLLLLLK